MINLELDKPLVGFDLETTGLDHEKDEIVEIALKKYNPNGTIEVKTSRFNPDIPISKTASSTHGITMEDVINEPKFKTYVGGIHSFMNGCDIIGYNNLYFDNPFLFYKFKKHGYDVDWFDINSKTTLLDVFVIEQVIQNTPWAGKLSKNYYKYNNIRLIDAHEALIDVNATMNIFNHQIDLYDYLNTVKDVKKFQIIRENIIIKDNDCIYNFGKNIEKSVNIDINYVNWFLNEEKFNKTSQLIVKNFLKRPL